MKQSNAGILWRGPSLFDGSPIVLVASGLRTPSTNTKTGDMLQTWILREDDHPVRAKRLGTDTGVCGDCPLASGHGCYVNVHYAPAALWRQLPEMPEITELRRDRPLRIGAYGDPAAVPIDVWTRILPQKWTGFTHQWRDARMQPFRKFCMASTEDTASTREAWKLGWRTFRMRPQGAALLAEEIECPAMVGQLQCAKCLLCRGTRLGAKSISLEVHGPTAKRATNVSRWLELTKAGGLTT